MIRPLSRVLCWCVLTAVAHAGDLIPLGPEFVGTSYTPNFQKQPWVAADDDGAFVLVYAQGDVFARLFDRDGNPLTDDFLVNPAIFSGEQDEVYAARDPVSGDFVLVWSDRHGNDGFGMGIGGRFYRADGTPYGPEQILNTHITFSQFEPHACFAPTGTVFVTWTDAGTDGSAGVIARLFDRTGVPLTGEFLVNEPSSKTQIDSNVACDRDGNFVVTYVDASGATGEAREVMVRRYDATGNVLGPATLVNSTSPGMQRDPIVAVAADGAFVVVFQDESGTDGSGWGIFARRFDAAGVPLGAQFVASVATAGDQKDPHVAMDYVGNFVVSWEETSGGTSDVMARRFDRAGNPLSGDLAVHAPGKPGHQNYHKFAISQSGQRMVATWADTDSNSYLRLFDLALITPDMPATRGMTTTLALDAPGMGGADYLLLPSLSAGPGFPVAGNRLLRLGVDPLLFYGIAVPNGPLFGGLAGTLDAAGAGQAAFHVPNDPAIQGVSVSFALVTYRNGTPADLELVSDTLTLMIQ